MGNALQGDAASSIVLCLFFGVILLMVFIAHMFHIVASSIFSVLVTCKWYFIFV